VEAAVERLVQVAVDLDAQPVQEALVDLLDLEKRP
jgi:hypothetical protein